jgi:hypothetical protein
MTRAARLCVLAGLAAGAAMMAAEASAQDCPQWLKWVCPDSASSTTASKGVRREKQLSRTKATSSSEAARRSRHDRRLARHGERQERRPEAAINDEEKEVLFRQFLEWEKRAGRSVD